MTDENIPRDVISLAVVGDALVDLIIPLQSGAMPAYDTDQLTSGSITVSAGGSACNVARHLGSIFGCSELPRGARCRVDSPLATSDTLAEVSVSFFTGLGTGSTKTWRDILLESCSASGVAVTNLLEKQPDQNSNSLVSDECSTGVCAIYTTDGKHGFFTHRGAVGKLSVTHFRENSVWNNACANFRHLHIGGLYTLKSLQDDLASLVKELKVINPKATISLDPNLASNGQWQGRWTDCLPYIDLFTPNLTEAQGILGLQLDWDHVDVDALMPKLLDLGPKVVALTAGSKGVYIATKDFPFFNIPAPKVTVVDTCGCGDAFTSGFLYRWVKFPLDDRFSPDALRAAADSGVKAGSFVATFLGATTKLVTKAVLDSES